MSKEEIAERAGLTLDAWEQGEPIDEISFADDIRNLIAFAIANKAAEEVELPVLPESTYNGYSDGSEPLWTKDQIHCYARQAIAADRASRQVANKAEVEPDFIYNGQPGRELEIDLEGYTHGTAFYATPPATTGASTVLTDERIDATMIKYSTMIAPGVYSLCNFGCDDDMRSFAREVAAQAGQVAVPEGWKLVPVEPTPEMLEAIEKQAIAQCSVEWDSDLGGNIQFGDAAEVYADVLKFAPSPAKESK